MKKRLFVIMSFVLILAFATAAFGYGNKEYDSYSRFGVYKGDGSFSVKAKDYIMEQYSSGELDYDSMTARLTFYDEKIRVLDELVNNTDFADEIIHDVYDIDNSGYTEYISYRSQLEELMEAMPFECVRKPNPDENIYYVIYKTSMGHYCFVLLNLEYAGNIVVDFWKSCNNGYTLNEYIKFANLGKNAYNMKNEIDPYAYYMMPSGVPLYESIHHTIDGHIVRFEYNLNKSFIIDEVSVDKYYSVFDYLLPIDMELMLHRDISVYVNNTKRSENGILTGSGNILIPFRDILEAMGATVEWNQERQSISIFYGDEYYWCDFIAPNRDLPEVKYMIIGKYSAEGYETALELNDGSAYADCTTIDGTTYIYAASAKNLLSDMGFTLTINEENNMLEIK